jgi:splicing factor 3A subunit 3
MEGILRVQRREHEEIDRLENTIVNVLLDPATTHKARLMQELTAAKLLDQLTRTAQHCATLYADPQTDRDAEIERITVVNSEFGNFYNDLKEVKDVHRRLPTDRPVDDSEFEALLYSAHTTDEAFDALFSGEESNGRYLDLILAYERYINLKGVRRLDYLQFLEEFDNFDAIPSTTKLSHAYSKYLDELETYFERFFRLTKPLFNFSALTKNEVQKFEEAWARGTVSGWEEATQKNNVVSEGIFCGPCNKTFTNKSVYQAHLGGRKHVKAAESFDSTKTQVQTVKIDPTEQPESNVKTLARREALVSKYAQVLGEVRSNTHTNVERKQSRTSEERAEDVLVEEVETPAEVEEEEDDGRIYNPLNLPLDWDGKPIPFWLWKLHGLGVRFPCEICGNHIYMGKKAFDQHFFEWRHSNGMKALGIPNTRHFFQITTIAEAQTLWDKLKQASRTETFRPEAMEEFEDHLGNVYNRKTYEDLRRQGLI